MTAVRHKGIALAVLALSQLMIVLDASIVNVALPTVKTALGFSIEDLQWVVNAYTLAFGGFLLLGGRFADRLGRKRIFIAGLALFTVASVLGGAAQTAAMLVGARAIQGLGGALMAPAALSLITVIFEEGEERNKAFGVWGAIAAGGAAIGVLLGGVLVEWLNWRSCFFVNIFFGVLAIFAAIEVVPESKDEQAPGFDVAGAVTVTGGLVALVFALVRGNTVGWATFQTVGTFVLAAGLLATFFVLQHRLANPLMPLRIFGHGNVLGADLAGLLVGSGMFGMFFYISLYLQTILHYSAIKTGMAFLPVSLVIMASAGIASNMLTNVGPRRLAAAGLATASAGMLALIRVHPGGDYLGTVIGPLVVIGFGMGFGFVSLTSAAVAGVPKADSGLASAMLNTGQQIGGSLGLAVLTAVSIGRFNALNPDQQDASAVASATTSGWAWGFGVCAALLLTGAIVSAMLVDDSMEELEADAEEAAAAVSG